MHELNLRQLTWWNLQQMGLTHPFTDNEQTVKQLVCVQAQDFACAEQAVGLRTSSPRALTPLLLPGGPLVRLWTVRGTMHLVPREEAAYHQAATLPEWSERWGKYLQHRLPEPLATVRQQVYPHIVEVLSTQAQTHAQIAQAAGLTEQYGRQLPHLLKDLCYLGGCVRGPQIGGKAVYFAPWHKLLPPDSSWVAKRFLLNRFIDRYGPVTIADMVYWSGLRVPTVRRIVQELQPNLSAVQLPGQKGEAYLQSDQLPQLLELRPPADPAIRHLLPAFDVLLLAYKDKQRFIDQACVSQVFLPAARVSPIVLEGTRVVGTWQGNPPQVRRFVAEA